MKAAVNSLYLRRPSISLFRRLKTRKQSSWVAGISSRLNETWSSCGFILPFPSWSSTPNASIRLKSSRKERFTFSYSSSFSNSIISWRHLMKKLSSALGSMFTKFFVEPGEIAPFYLLNTGFRSWFSRAIFFLIRLSRPFSVSVLPFSPSLTSFVLGWISS